MINSFVFFNHDLSLNCRLLSFFLLNVCIFSDRRHLSSTPNHELYKMNLREAAIEEFASAAVCPVESSLEMRRRLKKTANQKGSNMLVPK